MLSALQLLDILRLPLIVIYGLDFLLRQLDVLRRGAVGRVFGVGAADVGHFGDHVVGHGEDADADVLEAHSYVKDYVMRTINWKRERGDQGIRNDTYDLDPHTSASMDGSRLCCRGRHCPGSRTRFGLSYPLAQRDHLRL